MDKDHKPELSIIHTWLLAALPASTVMVRSDGKDKPPSPGPGVHVERAGPMWGAKKSGSRGCGLCTS